MAKRRKKTKAKARSRKTDPCAAQRQRLNDIDAQIADLMDQANDPDIPSSVRKKLLAKLKLLQQRRQGALAALDRCEMSHTRRGGMR